MTAILMRSTIPAEIDVFELIKEAKEAFYKDPNVIGVGIGSRRKGGVTLPDEEALVVYVKEKLAKNDVRKEHLIPDKFGQLRTDVWQPFGPDAPQEPLGFFEAHEHSEDMMFVDLGRLHEQWTEEAGGEVEFHGAVQEFGDVCVIQDDGTLIKTVNGQQVVDWVRAYRLFRTIQPDIYDFVTFFTDTAHGMPPQGGSSWYSFVHNDIQGIGLGAFNNRPAFGSNVLQGIMFLNQGHFGLWRYVMLQEQGHRWGAFARYRETATGPLMNDHMLGGWAHWAYPFDDDRSPMDYDTYDWVAQNGDFARVSLTSAERVYCDLDLYVMGLLGPEEVGDFYLLSNLAQVSGNLYSATKKRLTAQNIIWAEGARNPSVATSPKLIKNGFIVLTGDMSRVHDLVDRVDALRLSFERDFADATKSLARVDTTLGPLRTQLTPSQIRELTGGGYTSLHRHLVGLNDLRISGTQFTGTLSPGQTQLWFTHSWPADWNVYWAVRPTTVSGGGRKIGWTVETERPGAGFITYWITVRNLTSETLGFEARYSVFR
jgi:hypothetical protein